MSRYCKHGTIEDMCAHDECNTPPSQLRQKKIINTMMKQSHFTKELARLINEYSKENGSDTPDFILAQYLESCLENFDLIVRKREHWYGRDPKEVEEPISIKID